MILKDSLYKVLSIGDNVAEIELILDNKIYKAHFPGKPITPGVCIIGICRELAEEITGRSLKLIAAKDIKYQSLLTPDSSEPTRVEFSKFADNGEEGLAITANVTRADVKIAKLSLVLA